MKKFLNISIAIIIAVCFFACEKDDICPETTPTTSRLILEFYDFANPADKKNVVNLSAIGNDQPTGVVFTTALDSTKYFANATSKVALPLDISRDSTSYKLRIFSENTDPTVFNDDEITIRYTTEQIYVSRACGYKTIFYLNNVVRNANGNDNNQWIRNLTFEPIIIDNEQDIHVKIYW